MLAKPKSKHFNLPILYQSWGEKLGAHWFSGFKKRYFLLHGNIITYGESVKGVLDKPKGHTRLTPVTKIFRFTDAGSPPK